MKKSEAPMSVHVGHALTRGGSVATKRAAIGGKEAGEGKGEEHFFPSKPEMNRSSLDQTKSKTPRQPKQRKR
jgi:hypothetical protein